MIRFIERVDDDSDDIVRKRCECECKALRAHTRISAIQISLIIIIKEGVMK
jgi:hypothetical protein